jgi:FkbM family methyltransferase
MNILDRLKDAIVIDVGAHIGQFSLFAAKIGRNVVAIEPFYDNIIRFHKAVAEEDLQSQIRLITSAVSDESNQILPLQKVEKNIGGQYLLRSKEKFSRQDRVWNKYLVETMLFDDILDYLPKASNNKTQTVSLK